MGIYAKANLDTSWQDEANCLGVDPDLFFPERGASTREAKEVCLSLIHISGPRDQRGSRMPSSA